MRHRSTADSPAIFVDEIEGGKEEEEKEVSAVAFDRWAGGDRRRMVHSDPACNRKKADVISGREW